MKRKDFVSLILIGYAIVCMFIWDALNKVPADDVEGILNSFLALASLGLALITTVVGHWNRTDSQRQTLYETQLSAYKDLVADVLQLSDYASAITKKAHFSHEEAVNLYRKFRGNVASFFIVLPGEVIDDLLDLLLGFQEILNSSEPAKQKVAAEKFLSLPTDTINLMRDSAGIEELNKDTAALMKRLN